MKITFFSCCFFFALCSCASLSKTQLKEVNKFARASENFSAYPGKVLEALSVLRMSSGVYFANSLSDPRTHLEELDGIYNLQRTDQLLTAKADVTFKIIDQYAKALVLLSSDSYATDASSQATRLAVNLDSLITLYNSLDDTKRLPSTAIRSFGEALTAGGRLYIRARQARQIKKFVPAADTLIAVMTGNLIEIFDSGTMVKLIDNERKNIRSNYLSYLAQARTLTSVQGKTDTMRMVSDTRPGIENDRDYLRFKAAADTISNLRMQTIAATRKLRKAHAKLNEIIGQKITLTGTIREMEDFYAEVSKVKLVMAQLDKLK